MAYISPYKNYDKFPEKRIDCPPGSACEGYAAICRTILEKAAGREKCIVAVDCYPGVDMAELTAGLGALSAGTVVYSDDCFIQSADFTAAIRDNLTGDRVFGRMTCRRLEDYLDEPAAAAARRKIAGATGLVLVIGVGATLLAQPDILVYADMARWEIQTRYKAGAPNWRSDNGDEPFLSKVKRGYFVIWRLADRHKRELFDRMDFLLDTNRKGEPKMMTGAAFRQALETFAREPFRLVPYFDPGVWGGQWMKGMLDLPDGPPNYAWSFDGVPEENSLYVRVNGIRLEIPAMDLVLYRPVELLGPKVFGRFGAEFPIRFDFLDTMGGGNLSLQVHPLITYIQERFGMHYTQDESYYILAAEEDACVYLGLKEGVDKAAMAADLYRAQAGEIQFPAEKYVNKFPAKVHDHFSIPAGTVHCSGKNAMVLEISATPYIFTFKLWDWGRVGLDGLPRPIHLEHGLNNIQWDRTTGWVRENLVGQVESLPAPEGVTAQRTGLQEREFIETIRHRSAGKVLHERGGSVHVLNLVEGGEAVVESPDGRFDPFVVHYAETFILPEIAGPYTIRPYGISEGREVVTIQAKVRV